ncbi:YueI family protein [Sporosarcina sp. FSL K6-3457]|uniref:YueI family protein n=1 Tax=Sporosarcina sp. FSL K6-3457 TaxID=2978204 RepID=UPI0030F68305
MSNNVDDYLQRGIYGAKETKPAERRKFLSTIRERVVIALTQAQVREPGTYQQVEEAMQGNREARLYLNGHMSYGEFSKYIKIASKYNIDFTIVTNKNHNSKMGLVLAYDYAIDKEEIYVKKVVAKAKPKKNKNKGLTDIFTKLFKKD